jgi:hypothetical protein
VGHPGDNLKTMNPPVIAARPEEISVLLRGEPGPITAWTAQWSTRRCLLHVAAIVAGGGLYGAAMGWWRDPEQAVYTAIKFPLIILLTTLGNALLNAMLAPLLGLNIPIRQSFQGILMSFTIATAILGSFAPVIAFMVWNAPSLSAGGVTYSLIILTHVVVIAFAGIVGNLRLFQLLLRLGGSRAIAQRVLLAWLAGNFVLGTQLSWILRPFIGSPGLPVEFIRHGAAFKSNFFESVVFQLVNIFRSP